LGLPEAELTHDQLRDPFGIAFWPEFRGRDGGRTPMPWQEKAPAGGFTTGTPWLPVPADHRIRAVDRQERDPDSALANWRRFLKARKAMPALLRGGIDEIHRNGEVLSFVRCLGDERVLCVFNLSSTPARFAYSAWGREETNLLLPAWGTMVLTAGRAIRSIAA